MLKFTSSLPSLPFHIPLPALLLPFLLTACHSVAPPTAATPQLPSQWHVGLPKASAETSLVSWWQRQGDATLLKLIEQAQLVSPTVAQAFTRIQQARVVASAASLARAPTLDAGASASRAHGQFGFGPATSSQIGLQSAWEIDLFGANRASDQAAMARLQGSNAGWHDARISVAAEVANLYIDVLACRQMQVLAQKDAASRAATTAIVVQSAAQGMSSQLAVAQARAAAAEANSRVLQQQTQCEQTVKALVVLTAIPEPDLQALLQQAPQLALQAPQVASVPAALLRQRPDVFTAERDVAAASLEIGAAEARRYPRLSLNGSIGTLRQRSNGVSDSMQTWSIGPLAITYPIIDAGQRRANIDLAKAQYNEAASGYAAKVRVAVREVEEALLNLQGAGLRQQEADVVSRANAASLSATEAKRAQGMASVLEVEEVRRMALAAESTQTSLQQERNRAIVALYRALGGGWDGTPSS